MRRAAFSLSSLAIAGALLLAGPGSVARADDGGADAATSPPLSADQEVCVGSTEGSACHSSTTAAGGTCLPGCCANLVNGPELPPVYEDCLACSDTSGKDPSFSSTACGDGGAGSTTPQDAGTIALVEAGTAASPAPVVSSSGCAVARQGASSSSSSSAGWVAFGLLGIVGMRRRRRQKSAP